MTSDRGEPIAIGIDVAEPRKGLDLVALDAGRTIVASRGRLTLDEVTRTVADLRVPGRRLSAVPRTRRWVP